MLPPKPTGEACGGFSPAPKGCPAGQVCVDKVDPMVVADVPGVCVTRVDCGGVFGDTCPRQWKCRVVGGGGVGYCEYDFGTRDPLTQPTPVPLRPTGRVCFTIGKGRPLVPCPSGQRCVARNGLTALATGVGVCIDENV